MNTPLHVKYILIIYPSTELLSVLFQNQTTLPAKECRKTIQVIRLKKMEGKGSSEEKTPLYRARTPTRPTTPARPMPMAVGRDAPPDEEDVPEEEEPELLEPEEPDEEELLDAVLLAVRVTVEEPLRRVVELPERVELEVMDEFPEAIGTIAVVPLAVTRAVPLAAALVMLATADVALATAELRAAELVANEERAAESVAMGLMRVWILVGREEYQAGVEPAANSEAISEYTEAEFVRAAATREEGRAVWRISRREMVSTDAVAVVCLFSGAAMAPAERATTARVLYCILNMFVCCNCTGIQLIKFVEAVLLKYAWEKR